MTFPLEKLLGKSLADDLFPRFFNEFEDNFEMEVEDDTIDIKSNRSGFCLVLDKERNVVTTIFYYSEFGLPATPKKRRGSKGKAPIPVEPFQGKLPGGIKFSMSLEQVRKKLGEPFDTGGGVPSVISGIVPIWEKFDCGKHELHVQLDAASEHIALVTLMISGLFPRD